MMSANQIIKELSKKKNNIFKTFFINSNDRSKFEKFKNFKNFKTVIIIGMGGSILASKAIYHFLKHKIKKKFIFIDNLDENFLLEIKKKNNLSKCLFLIISKSGNTNETIVNLNFFKPFLKKKNTIILSENKNNFFRNFANNMGFTFVKHDPLIGGRYSVFSEVGMLPVYLMGLNPENFKKDLTRLINNKKFLSNSLKEIKRLNLKNSRILIFFNYVPELENFLMWSQQLLAESLGKKKKGFVPMVSNAPKDHHSLLQLYLDGPKDKIFYVLSSKKSHGIKNNADFLKKNMQHLNKKKFSEIKLGQKNAFIKVLKGKKIPFREIFIEELNEKTIGKLFFLLIFETIAIGKMMNVNVYDQPAVEEVKILTREFLNLKKFKK